MLLRPYWLSPRAFLATFLSHHSLFLSSTSTHLLFLLPLTIATLPAFRTVFNPLARVALHLSSGERDGNERSTNVCECLLPALRWRCFKLQQAIGATVFFQRDERQQWVCRDRRQSCSPVFGRSRWSCGGRPFGAIVVQPGAERHGATAANNNYTTTT